MSSIDLVILGMVIEKPQSAYDIQKDVEYHHFSRWTKISIPIIYKKVLQLYDKGYLESHTVKGKRFTDKTLYSITDKGKKYFEELMTASSEVMPSFLFDFNAVIANLNKLDNNKAIETIQRIKNNIKQCKEKSKQYSEEYPDLPLVGKTVFDQQKLLYAALSEWIDNFETQFREQCSYDD